MEDEAVDVDENGFLLWRNCQYIAELVWCPHPADVGEDYCESHLNEVPE